MSFRRIYPDIGAQKILFDGGLNNKFEKSNIPDNESPDCLNVVFDNGSVGTRGGTSKLNTTSVGTFVFDGLYTREDKNANETMVAFAGGHMFALATTTFVTVPSAQSVFTAGFRVGCAHAENYLFIGNGGVDPYKWNGSEFTRHGIPAPTATAAAASQSAGGLTGDYRYKFTNVNSASVESDVSPVMSTFAAAGATIRVTIATAPASHGVNARKIYRTEAGGSTYKLVTTISDNTTTTYDDSTADASLGATAPTDQGVPPKYQVIAFHPGVGRLFVNDPSNENYVFYSEANNPYVFKATNFDRFGDKAADTVQALAVYENTLVVTGKKKIYIWYFPDNDPSNWVKIVSRSPYGCSSPFGIVPYENGLLVPVMENDKFVGFSHLVGDSLKPDATLLTVSSVGSLTLSDKFETDIFSVQETYIKNISAISFKSKIYIAVTYGDGSTTNNRIFVFDHSYSRINKGKTYSWVPWTGLNPAQFTIYNGKLYYASSTATGFVYEMNTTSYNDDGSAINSYFYTKEFFGYLKDANFHKDFRFVQMLVDNAGDYYMDVTTKIDSDKGVGTVQSIDIDPGSTLWNGFIWGSSNWGGGQNQSDIKLDLGRLNGKRIQFKFSNQNTVNQRFKVHYMSFTYNLKGLR